MSEIAIRAEGLSKQYQIGARQERYRTFRDTVAGMFSRKRAAKGGGKKETVWALKDIFFEVRRGEVLGIIGRNGAGKSTLLKILSRITEPSNGCADIYGRVGSLLEVGTGFHPELTGRENIYLNGAILGMQRSEIARQFDEIVAFAEVEKFIDTPVKHYSSGMYLRLAFAVAAHLQTDILLVDEVLAVGDVAFQKKCLAKVGAVANDGRTVLLVSHNMAAIHSLSTCCAVLAGGGLRHFGGTAEAIQTYNRQMNAEQVSRSEDGSAGPGITLCAPVAHRWNSALPFTARFAITLPSQHHGADLFCILSDSDGNRLVRDRIVYTDRNDIGEGLKTWMVNLEFPPLWVKPGLYSIELRAFAHGLGRQMRYTSEPATLEAVIDSHTSMLDCILAPQIEWTVGAPELLSQR